MIEYGVEKIQNAQHELGVLFDEHYDINCPMPDKLKAEPDWERWFQLQDMDMFRLFTARKNSRLIGYIFLFIAPSFQYKTHLFAVVDMIYVRKQNRASGAGYYLLKYAEDYIKQLGVSVMGISTTVDAPFDKLLNRLGYELRERSYSKWIGE